jgi:hypothetical protein
VIGRAQSSQHGQATLKALYGSLGSEISSSGRRDAAMLLDVEDLTACSRYLEDKATDQKPSIRDQLEVIGL